MNKLIMALMFALSSLSAVAYADLSEDSLIDDSTIQRGPPRGPPRGPRRPPGVPPPPRGIQYIGNFATGNPFSWDNDTVSTSYRDYWYGVVFELAQGVDVELASITVTCSRGRICFSSRLRDYVERGRPLYVNFPNWLDVVAIQVRSKPAGFSVPGSEVNVYLYQ